MTGQRMDFMEFKKSMIDQFGDLGFTEEELMSEVRRLKILRFDLDKKGLNIVSQFEGTIVFIDPKYDGEQVNRGEIWLCSIRSVSTVYNAIPLRRINASILMGLDEGMRRSIVDSLWKSNRVQFEEIFKENLPTWETKDFYEREISSAGIMRNHISVPCDIYFTMERKIHSFLESTFLLYKVPDEKIKEAIEFVSGFDWKSISDKVIENMLSYLESKT